MSEMPGPGAPADRIRGAHRRDGYEIAPEFRGQGFGVAAARALIDRAVASDEVDHVLAHTMPGPNPSTGVLVSLGFEHTDDLEDPEAGVVWEWRWTRPG